MNIGEAARGSGVSAKMIRYYEEIGLLPNAPRSAAGYRIYGEAEMHVLRFVARARDLGFSIERIRGLLALWSDKGRTSAEVKKIVMQQVAALEKASATLDAMRNALLRLAGNCHGDHRPNCPIIDDLAKGPEEGEPLVHGAVPLTKPPVGSKHCKSLRKQQQAAAR